MILFPTTLLALAVTEAFRGTLGKRLALLGNISYSTYLLHFPLQLGCIIGARSLSLPTTFFYSPWVMLGFFGVLIPISVCSYYFLERPCQKILRQTLLAEKVDPKCKIVSTVPTP